MNNTAAPTQFEFNFNQSMPLADDFRRGRFTVLVEVTSPALNQPFDSAMVPAVALARRMEALEHVEGILVTEGSQTHKGVAACAVLRPAAPTLPIMLTVSGRDLTPTQLRETMARAESAAVQNFLLVTGDGLDADPAEAASLLNAKPGQPRNAAETARPVAAQSYLDSVEMLRLADDQSGKRLLGAGINPYRYTAADQFLQFYKARRKIASGAHFLIAQAGWDLKKLQEFQWFLQRHELQVPMLARFHLVHPDEAGRLHEGLHVGVTVSRNYLAMIQREHRDAATPGAFLEIQLERLGLLMAGARYLGCSGVVVSGVQDVQTLNRLNELVELLAAKYPNYNAWLAAWEKFHEGVALAPGLHAFYGYRNLLAPGMPMFDEGTCKPEKAALPQATASMRFRSWSLGHLLQPSRPEKLKELVRNLFFPGCRLPDDHLRFVYHCNPAECPKQLVFGSCGATKADGSCEFHGGPCFFEKVVAIANSRGSLSDLERSPWTETPEE